MADIPDWMCEDCIGLFMSADAYFQDAGVWVDTPNSSNVHSVAFFNMGEGGGSMLGVRFKHRPGNSAQSEYRIKNVLASVFLDFLNDSSAGSFYWREFRKSKNNDGTSRYEIQGPI